MKKQTFLTILFAIFHQASLELERYSTSSLEVMVSFKNLFEGQQYAAIEFQRMNHECTRWTNALHSIKGKLDKLEKIGKPEQQGLQQKSNKRERMERYFVDCLDRHLFLAKCKLKLAEQTLEIERDLLANRPVQPVRVEQLSLLSAKIEELLVQLDKHQKTFDLLKNFIACQIRILDALDRLERESLPFKKEIVSLRILKASPRTKELRNQMKAKAQTLFNAPQKTLQVVKQEAQTLCDLGMLVEQEMNE